MTGDERKLAEAVHRDIIVRAGSLPAYRGNTTYHEGPDAELRVLIDQQAARIEALTAERDAAVARYELELAARDMIRAEGERRATAAIVEWLRGDVIVRDSHGYIMPLTYQRDPELADAIERGDHLTAHKPLDT